MSESVLPMFSSRSFIVSDLVRRVLTSRSPFPYLGGGDRKPVGLCGSAECMGAGDRGQGAGLRACTWLVLR